MTVQEYEIRVKGLPEAGWAVRFEDVEILSLGNQEFLLRGMIPDQPALHGLLGRIRATGLALISVRSGTADKKPEVR